LVTVNPVLNAGRLVSRRDSSNSHIDPLTAEEVRILLKTAQDRWAAFYPVLLCAVRTGLREGELIGLQWGDIDFQGQFLEVRRGIVRHQVTTPKTHKIRRVDLSPQLAGVLAALKETRGLEYAMKGQPMPDWVFLGPSVQRLSASTLRKALYRSLEAAGLRHVRFHDLRHTFASLLIQQGANPKYIQEQLGHGTISVTLNIYCHLFPGEHRHHVQALDDPQDAGPGMSVEAAKSATQPQPGRVGEAQPT
jgi:integrase